VDAYNYIVPLTGGVGDFLAVTLGFLFLGVGGIRVRGGQEFAFGKSITSPGLIRISFPRSMNTSLSELFTNLAMIYLGKTISFRFSLSLTSSHPSETAIRFSAEVSPTERTALK
jgi:long-subunit fatty acid transport protein